MVPPSCHRQAPTARRCRGSANAFCAIAAIPFSGREKEPGMGPAWPSSGPALLLGLDLFEFGAGALELVVEQPHRIEDVAKGRRDSCPVGLAEGEDAVVAQV